MTHPWPLKGSSRDTEGVLVTLIAANCFGRCQKEISPAEAAN
jgi:hypothetical protein